MLKQFADMTVAVGETPMMGDAASTLGETNRILVGHPHVHIASRFVENNASWYFLLEGNDGQWILNGDMVKFSIDVALQHTVEGFVEEWTVPFTAYKGQYSILRFEFKNDTSFKMYERIGIYQREPCPTKVFVGYDRLPELTLESMTMHGLDEDGIELTLWVHQDCKVLYLVLLLKQDCLDLSYKVSRVPPDLYTRFELVEPGKESSVLVHRAKEGDVWNLYGVVKPFRALKLNVTRKDGTPFQFINIRASQGNVDHDGTQTQTNSVTYWQPKSLHSTLPWTVAFSPIREEAVIHISSGEIVLSQETVDFEVEGTVTFVTTPSIDTLFCIEKHSKASLLSVSPPAPSFFKVEPEINGTEYVCIGNLQINSLEGTWFQMKSSQDHVAEKIKVYHAYSPVVSFDTPFHVAPAPDTVDSTGYGFFSFRAHGGSILVLDLEPSCKLGSTVARDAAASSPADIDSPVIFEPRSGKFAFFSTSDETSWLIDGQISGSCFATVTSITRVEIQLKEEPVEVDLSDCLDMCPMQPGTVEKCCHSFLKVNVNRPVAAVEFRSATWISVATGTFEDAAGPANRDLRRIDNKGRSIQQYWDFGHASSESIILVPTRQIQGPSVSTKFYLSTIKNQSTPLKVTVYSPIPQAFHLGDTSIPVSDRMQIFELPYEPGMNVIRVDVSISDCPQGQDSTWLFGAGGIQTQIGMNFRSGGDQRGLLCGEREWFYSRGEFDSKPNSSFYLVVPAHSKAGIIHV